MSLFLITFLSLYGGMHIYVFLRLRPLLPNGSPLLYLLGIALLVMTIAPLATRGAEHAGMVQTARMIAWPGYSWMGFVFLLASTLAGIDILRGVIRIVDLLCRRNWSDYLPAAGATTIAAVLLATAAAVYAVYEANHIRPEHVSIPTSRLPAGRERVRIVQVSDIHVGLLMTRGRLKRIADAVQAARPDILVSTGDLVDGRLGRDEHLESLDNLAGILAQIPAPDGKFAVTGNHEFYAGLNSAVRFTQSAGFTVLRSSSAVLPAGLSICGVDDPAGTRQNTGAGRASEQALLRELPEKSFRLLLKHRPVVAAASQGLFDLQLSGHVHQGQLFPFNLLVRLAYPLPCGTTATGSNAYIHVSRGSGTWGPVMRLWAPPEVTVIDLIPFRPQS